MSSGSFVLEQLQKFTVIDEKIDATPKKNLLLIFVCILKSEPISVDFGGAAGGGACCFSGTFPLSKFAWRGSGSSRRLRDDVAQKRNWLAF